MADDLSDGRAMPCLAWQRDAVFVCELIPSGRAWQRMPALARCRRSGRPDLKSGYAVVRVLRPSTVLGVGDVVTPGGRTLGDGDVGHEVVVGGTMPVVLTVRGEVDVAGADLDDLLAP